MADSREGQGGGSRYLVRERRRIGVWEVIDLADPDEPVVFSGIAEDCDAWVSEHLPDSRDGQLGGWIRRSHSEAIGEIQEHNPWVEDTWSVGPLCLVHRQNIKTPTVMSARSPRHTWRLLIARTTVELSIRYGLAPYA